MLSNEATGTAMAVPAAPDRAAAPPAIEPARARSLHRWNVSLAGLHAIQALAILAISFAKSPVVSAPVVSSYLSFDTATQTLVPAQRQFEAQPQLPLSLRVDAVGEVVDPARHRAARGHNTTG